ncbi:MAG: hypothetical protein KC496_12395, partial [Anaerolineae bacterium]|nr:hypothetical protein [Anaerolineae bacterium]
MLLKLDESIGAFMQQRTVFLQPDWDLDFGNSPQVEIRLVQPTMTGLYALCVAHSAVRVGDTFHRVEWFQPQQVPDHKHGRLLAEVRLEVTRLIAFHNVLNRASAGMNVGMELSGDGVSLLDVLQGQGWCYSDGLYHHWVETVQDMPKI